jgi:hypothetical protein
MGIYFIRPKNWFEFSLDRMVPRASSVILFLIATAAAANAAAAVTLHSQRRNITVSVMPPAGWRGPSHQVWPSYDAFTFSDHHKPTPCSLEVRFDPYSDEPGDRHSPEDIAIHWSTTPIDAIRAQLRRDYTQPRVQRVATVSAAAGRIRVYAVYHAPDYDYYAADVPRGDTVISLALYSEHDRDLDRHRAEFLSFVRSLRIT